MNERCVPIRPGVAAVSMKRKSPKAKRTHPRKSPDKGVKCYVKLSPEDRSCLVQCVFSELTTAEQAQAKDGRPDLVRFKVERKGCSLHNRCSALGRALEAAVYARHRIRLSYPLGDTLKQAAGRKAAKRWFVIHYSDPLPKNCFSDLSTHVTVGKHLAVEQWDELHDVLIEYRWRDESGNHRRFRGFKHYMEWLGARFKATGSLEVKYEMMMMQEFLLSSQARGWQHLTDTVACRFDLKLAREQWKDKRDGVGAQNEAKRWRGELPCSDCYYRKASNARRAPNASHNRIIKCLPATPESGELAGIEPATYTYYHQPSMNQVLLAAFCDPASRC